MHILPFPYPIRSDQPSNIFFRFLSKVASILDTKEKRIGAAVAVAFALIATAYYFLRSRPNNHLHRNISTADTNFTGPSTDEAEKGRPQAPKKKEEEPLIVENFLLSDGKSLKVIPSRIHHIQINKDCHEGRHYVSLNEDEIGNKYTPAKLNHSDIHKLYLLNKTMKSKLTIDHFRS